MQSGVLLIFGLLGVALLLIAAAHALCVLAASIRWATTQHPAPAAGRGPPVSVLKPLCGAEDGLYENLRSFCAQDYAEFEVIFGVQRADDPALKVVSQLVQEFPSLAIKTVVDERSHGANRKVGNLQNIVRHARHDYWVIADSDAEVSPGYLSAVTAPLGDPAVGLVTCLYRDVPRDDMWSRLAAMYVNDWFMPSVRLSWALGNRDYVSGQTISMRRDTVTAIGGLAALEDHLADDYQLGELVRRAGRRIVLSDYVPLARHHEPTLANLIQHEIRWMRTIAVLKPGSFRLLFLSFSLPLAFIGLVLADCHSSTRAFGPWLAAATLLLRLQIHGSACRMANRRRLRDAWLIPLRDLLTAYVWARALRASNVIWRGTEFRVGEDGILHLITKRAR